MPAGKRQQTNNTTLYILIAFVGLFIAATTVAIIFYVKFEEHRTKTAALQRQMNELAKPAELRKIGTIVGAKQARKSRLGTMVDYLDKTVSLIVGPVPEDTSAEVKVDTVDQKVKETLELLIQQGPVPKNARAKGPTNQLVELLSKGKFSTVRQNFGEMMKDAFSVEKLEETWKLTISQMGPFKQQIGLRTEKQLNYDIAFVTCEFEKGFLDVKVAYNDKKEVAGLFFTPTAPEVLKSYQSSSESITAEQISIEIDDPNSTGLIRIIEKLKAQLGYVRDASLATRQQLKVLNNRFDDAAEANFEKEQKMLAEKQEYQQQLNDAKQDYSDLKALLEQTSQQRVQTLMVQLDEERTNRKTLRQQVLKTQAELKIAQDKIKRTEAKLQAIVPPPDAEVPAYKSDGKIILIDDRSQIVSLDIGIDDQVYPGLTFSVYDKDMPIPRDGKGKAQIEVFNVNKNISTARIIPSTVKRPIILGDIVANLIWDSDQIKVFTIAGEFDLDDNGSIDYDASDKIKALIEKWGGAVADTVSIETDFLVLGKSPSIPRKPSFLTMEVDPMAMEKYESALRKLGHYQAVQVRAESLSIPIFNLERFLYFIGYKKQSTRPGAF